MTQPAMPKHLPEEDRITKSPREPPEEDSRGVYVQELKGEHRMTLSKSARIIALLLAQYQIAFADETYIIDKSHASIGFAVSHLVISKVKGKFTDFSGSITLDENNKLKEAICTIKVSSIDTDIEKRDKHLLSADFFDAKKFNEITFRSTKVNKRSSKNILIGDFTLHGVTKQLILPFTLKGPITDPWGASRIGFEVQTVINRTEYGLTWNKALESGGFVVGEDVAIDINLEAKK